MGQSKFQKWFVGQHGPRPSRIDTARLRDTVKSKRIMLSNDESLLEACERWDDRWTSALWAWQVADK